MNHMRHCSYFHTNHAKPHLWLVSVASSNQEDVRQLLRLHRVNHLPGDAEHGVVAKADGDDLLEPIARSVRRAVQVSKRGSMLVAPSVFGRFAPDENENANIGIP